MKRCTKCKLRKDKSCYYKDARGSNGLRAICKKCDNTKRKKWRQNSQNRKKDSMNHMKYHRTKKGKKAIRRQSLKSRYGLTLGQYDKLLEAQNGVCAICKQPETRMFKGQLCPLSVDHNHITGEIRALLCSHCNHILGDAMDSKEILLRAALYLGRHSD